MCTAKPRTARATMARRTRAMIAGTVIGLHSCRSGVLMSQGCRRRSPASIRISPGSSLRSIPDGIRAEPDPMGSRTPAAGAELELSALCHEVVVSAPASPKAQIMRDLITLPGNMSTPSQGGRGRRDGRRGLNKENNRRTEVVGFFPNPEALPRLAGALPATRMASRRTPLHLRWLSWPCLPRRPQFRGM